MDVIRMDEESKKAIIKYPEECMCCDYCELDCPVDAIYVSPEKYAPLMVSWC
jgi:NAD-dependent dihydropyrimidine dehydrogenase PreA subunit